MEKTVKNKFAKYIYITLIVNLVSMACMIISIYFFATEYTEYFLQTDQNFWIGYVLIITMIITIASFLVSLSIMWKLIYDYRWRKKQDTKEKNDA